MEIVMKVIRIMRILLGGALLLLGFAALVYILAGSWAFDINIDQVTYWFLFTAIALIALAIVVVCVWAIILLLFGGLIHPAGGALFGGSFGDFLTSIPVVLVTILVFMIFVVLANWLRESLGYPYVEFTDVFEQLFSMIG